MSTQVTVQAIVVGPDLVAAFPARPRSCMLQSLVIVGPDTTFNAWSPRINDPYSLLTTTLAGANNHAEFQYPPVLNRGEQLYAQWAGVTTGSAVCTATFSDTPEA